MTWITVGKDDCSECNGTGVSSPELLQYRSRRELIDEGYRCEWCKGTGEEEIGYQNFADPSGR